MPPSSPVICTSQETPYRATGSDGSTAMVELASGVALWYHGGPPRLPIRWVVIRYLEERRGPYALLCTDTAAEPLRILQWYLLRWQVEVTPYQVRGRLFEELRAHLGLETQRQWSERAIARTTPALFGLFSVVTLAADILIEQRGGMAPRTAAWYDKTSPSFADAIALVRRHLWVQQGTFMPTLMSRNFRLPCTIELQPLSLTLLKMRKVEQRAVCHYVVVSERPPRAVVWVFTGLHDVPSAVIQLYLAQHPAAHGPESHQFHRGDQIGTNRQAAGLALVDISKGTIRPFGTLRAGVVFGGRVGARQSVNEAW